MTQLNLKISLLTLFVFIISFFAFIKPAYVNRNESQLIAQDTSIPTEYSNETLPPESSSSSSDIIHDQERPISEDNDFSPKLDELSNLSYNVVLEPLHHTVISAEITSPVLKINKRMGDTFEADEILMELDDKVYVSNYRKAITAVRRFQTELKAKKILYRDEALSLFELDEAYAQLASAQADLQLAKKLLNNTKVKVPYRGRVVKISIQEFELAQEGKEIIELVNNDLLYARFLVPSRLLSFLYVNAPVNIYINEINEWIPSKITRIAPVIDPSSSTIKVEAEIDNREGKLWAGMSGIAKIEKTAIDEVIEHKKEELKHSEQPSLNQNLDVFEHNEKSLPAESKQNEDYAHQKEEESIQSIDEKLLQNSENELLQKVENSSLEMTEETVNTRKESAQKSEEINKPLSEEDKQNENLDELPLENINHEFSAQKYNLEVKKAEHAYSPKESDETSEQLFSPTLVESTPYQNNEDTFTLNDSETDVSRPSIEFQGTFPSQDIESNLPFSNSEEEIYEFAGFNQPIAGTIPSQDIESNFHEVVAELNKSVNKPTPRIEFQGTIPSQDIESNFHEVVAELNKSVNKPTPRIEFQGTIPSPALESTQPTPSSLEESKESHEQNELIQSPNEYGRPVEFEGTTNQKSFFFY